MTCPALGEERPAGGASPSGPSSGAGLLELELASRRWSHRPAASTARRHCAPPVSDAAQISQPQPLCVRRPRRQPTHAGTNPDCGPNPNSPRLVKGPQWTRPAMAPATRVESADTVLDAARGWGVLDVNYGWLQPLRAAYRPAARRSVGRGPMWPTAPRRRQRGGRRQGQRRAGGRLRGQCRRLHRCWRRFVSRNLQSGGACAMAWRSGRLAQEHPPLRGPLPSMGLGRSVAGGERRSMSSAHPCCMAEIANSLPRDLFSQVFKGHRGATLRPRRWPWH